MFLLLYLIPRSPLREELYSWMALPPLLRSAPPLHLVLLQLSTLGEEEEESGGGRRDSGGGRQGSGGGRRDSGGQ